MNEMKPSSHQHGTPARDSVHHDDLAYWRRAHHDWRFWVALLFMLAAVTIYVMSDNLALPASRLMDIGTAKDLSWREQKR